MNIFTKTVVAAVGAALFTAAPAIANADRVYFLVGTRHVYRIGNNEYSHVDERRQIEEDYADQVAGDQDMYSKALANGADPNVEGPQLNQALNDLAAERDRRLSQLYVNVDFERTRHPEFRIQGDGPYQVIGINFHYFQSAEVFDNFVVYAPWPGYAVVDRPYGWNYGVVYTPGIFFNLYLGWHSHYYYAGGPAFFGFYGRSGAIGVLGLSRGVHGTYAYHPGGFRGAVMGGSRYTGGRPPVVNHYGGSRYSSGHVTTSPFSRPGSPSRYSSGNRPPSAYSHRTTSLYSHSTSGSFHSSHPSSAFSSRGYSHSSRPSPSHGSSGSFSHRSGSSFGQSHSTHTSSHGSSHGRGRG